MNGKHQADGKMPRWLVSIEDVKREAYLAGMQARDEAVAEVVHSMSTIYAIRSELNTNIGIVIGWVQAAPATRLRELLSAPVDAKGQTIADAMETSAFEWYRAWHALPDPPQWEPRMQFLSALVTAMRGTATGNRQAEQELRQLISDGKGDHLIDQLSSAAFELPPIGPPRGMKAHRKLLLDKWRQLQAENPTLSRSHAIRLMLDEWTENGQPRRDINPLEREAAQYLISQQDDPGRLWRELTRKRAKT